MVAGPPGYTDFTDATFTTDADGNVSNKMLGPILGFPAGSYTVAALPADYSKAYEPTTTVKTTSGICVLNGVEGVNGLFRIDAFGLGFAANSSAYLQLDYPGDLAPQDTPPEGNPILYYTDVNANGSFHLITGANCWPPGEQIKESIGGIRPDKSPSSNVYLAGYTGACAFLPQPPWDIGG